MRRNGLFTSNSTSHLKGSRGNVPSLLLTLLMTPLWEGSNNFLSCLMRDVAERRTSGHFRFVLKLMKM